MFKVEDEVVRYWRYRDLVRNLVHMDLKIRFQGTFLGIAWSLGVPFVMIILYDFVFGHLFRSPIPNFVLYLVVGLLHYNLLSQVITQGMGSLLGAASLVQRVYFPRLLVPTASTISSFIGWSASIVVLLITLPFIGGHLSLRLIPYVGMLALYLVMLWAVAIALSVMVIEFRDVRHLVEIGLTVLFWVTPIVYQLSSLNPAQQFIIELNPLTHFIICFQDLLFQDRLPSPIDVAISVGWTIGCVLVAGALFGRLKWIIELI